MAAVSARFSLFDLRSISALDSCVRCLLFVGLFVYLKYRLIATISLPRTNRIHQRRPVLESESSASLTNDLSNLSAGHSMRIKYFCACVYVCVCVSARAMLGSCWTLGKFSAFHSFEQIPQKIHVYGNNTTGRQNLLVINYSILLLAVYFRIDEFGQE